MKPKFQCYICLV